MLHESGRFSGASLHDRKAPIQALLSNDAIGLLAEALMGLLTALCAGARLMAK